MRHVVLVLDPFAAQQILSWAAVTEAASGLTPSEEQLRLDLLDAVGQEFNPRSAPLAR